MIVAPDPIFIMYAFPPASLIADAISVSFPSQYVIIVHTNNFISFHIVCIFISSSVILWSVSMICKLKKEGEYD